MRSSRLNSSTCGSAIAACAGASPPPPPYTPGMPRTRISRFGQVKVYLGKCFRIFFHEKQWKNLISALIIILIISMVTSEDMFEKYRDTKNGAFAIICACIWIGLFNSIQSICRERAIIKKEHRTGLHISSYILAHVIYEAIICAAETLIVFIVVLIKNADHLPPEGLILPMVLDLFHVLFLVTFGSDMMAMLISCIVKNENTAMTVMPFVLIIQLVMSGAVFPLNGAAKIIANLTLSKWGLDGVMAISSTNDRVWDESWTSLMMERPGEDIDPVRNAFEPVPLTLGRVELILLGFSLLYIVLAIIFLKQVDRDKR